MDKLISLNVKDVPNRLDVQSKSSNTSSSRVTQTFFLGIG